MTKRQAWMTCYQYFELQRASLQPMRIMGSGALTRLDTPGNPLRDTALGRLTAAPDHFEHNTQHFEQAGGVAHEGLFNGRWFRNELAPRTNTNRL